MTKLFDKLLEFLLSHDNESWERFLAWLMMMIIAYGILFREDKKIREGFKGENNLWELPEGIGYSFLYILPGILLSSFFLKWTIDERVMWIIDACLLSALGIRGTIDGIKHWKKPAELEPKPEEEKPKTPPAG